MSEETILVTQQVKENLLETCGSLGKSFLDSQENKRFISAREKFREDDEAKSILRDYNQTAQEYQTKAQYGGASKEEYKIVEEKNSAMLKNETLKNYFESQEALINLCKEVNEYISGKLNFNFASLAKPKSSCCS
ncbi:MAG TPA: YlbF family regulator [Ignavibacteriaceae bacterium]|nr:YlbF family regulator [Ignavibacteriaceae bacterium]